MDSAVEVVMEEARDWAELPHDVLFLIFQKLGGIEVLLAAVRVCSSWMRVCYDPQTWRHIDMWNPGSSVFSVYDLEKMTRAALDRSCGQCVEFSVGHFATDDLMQYLIDKVSILKGLCLVSCHGISNIKLIEVFKKFPLLEELEISCCSISKEVLESIGQSCPRLKNLKLNSYRNNCSIECDEEAFAIADNMTGLRSLQLFSHNLTSDGLWAILDRCPHLESLDLRQCLNIILMGDLRENLKQIKDLKLPDDPFDDSDVKNCGYGLYDDYSSSEYSEIDVLSTEMPDEYTDEEFDFSDFED